MEPLTERTSEVRNGCVSYMTELYKLVDETARRRLALEERWLLDTLQYQGKYDSATEAKLSQNKGSSKVFVNMTRPKTKVQRARLVDTLLPEDETNWDIEPTPVPRMEKAKELGKEEPQKLGILGLQEVKSGQGQRKLSEERVRAMKAKMRDQLAECEYPHNIRMAITQGCKLGNGVIKGPFKSNRHLRTWSKTSEQSDRWAMKLTPSDERVPMFDWVDLWDFYPDMDAASMADTDFVFQLHHMSKRQLRVLGQNEYFDPEEVTFLLNQYPSFHPPDGPNFTDNLKIVRQLENLDETSELNRFPVFEYHGALPYDNFNTLCRNFNMMGLIDAFEKTGDPLKTVDGSVWFCSDRILRFDLRPVDNGTLPYSVFSMDPTENTVIGSEGIPSMVRDPQSALNAAWRMALENGGLQGVGMYLIDKLRVEPAGDPNDYTIEPKKVWHVKTGLSANPAEDPIRQVSIGGNPAALLNLIEISRKHLDDESSLPLIAQGDPGTGARQTAHGLTILQAAMNIQFKDAARGFDDDITIPNMTRLYEWNMQYSDDESVKGDMRCKARGSSVLLMNEILSQNILMLLNLAGTHPEAFSMVKLDGLVRLWFKTLRLERHGLLKTDEELKEEEEARANEQPPVDPVVEGKKELAGIEHESKMAVLDAQMKVEVMKLANKENMTQAQIEAMLEKTRLTLRSKERATMAEFAIKEKHGTGI